ncbi:ABC transporter substrate-binding protein [Pontibacter sp. G13]|uniref:ABC transporter substrate-binding protein n=1 Tax=Pontibacter sp. G13 TaxID=3074898 RepID=UPI00288B0950|nr:ABC transporter substrate-binding protein [Pontibacter sp. G13]WNJ20056.1 ABC transporter substrate-binding protein [Pontibacter sp. G13]
MNLRILLLLLAVGMLSGCDLFRQAGGLPVDARSQELIDRGERYLTSGQYVEAMDAFEMASERDFNRHTTAAIYLSGLAAYYAGYMDIAESRFNVILDEYPKSKYVPDAQYHMALMALSSRQPAIRQEGAMSLIMLSKTGPNGRFKDDADTQVRKFLFEDASIDQLQEMYVSATSFQKTPIMEALGYKLIGAGEIQRAQEAYRAYIDLGGEKTEYLEQMFPEEMEETPKLVEPNILKVAMFLPLHEYQPGLSYQRELPEESVRGLEFYEGFRIAAEQFSAKSKKKVFIRVFDTRRDTNQTRMWVNQLDSLGPEVVVGAVYNSQSSIISEWSETRGVPQVVPISVTDALVEGRQHVFLAHPTGATHGLRMAEYARNSLGLDRVYVFTDGKSSTAQLAYGFIQRFKELGGRIDTMRLSQNYEIAVEQIPEMVEEIYDDFDSVGVYIPLMGNEEAAGLILNVLKQQDKQVYVMGSPHFRSRYNTLSRDTKESYNLLFSSSHMNNEAAPAYRYLYETYQRTYTLPPSDNVIQGYDLGMYLLTQLDRYNPRLNVPFSTYLRSAPRFSSIHLPYRFYSQQSNQEVNIGRYTPTGVERVNE